VRWVERVENGREGTREGIEMEGRNEKMGEWNR
jgi:hypothetical protein